MADRFSIHHSNKSALEMLSEAERGRLITALMEYSTTGIEPELRGAERILFPVMREQIDSERGSSSTPIAHKSDFDQFWTAYPRKIGRKAAQTAYGAMMKRPKPPTTEQLVASVEAHKALWDWKKDGGQFVPHPTTYLTQDRWRDDLTNEPKNEPTKSFGKKGAPPIEQNVKSDADLSYLLVDLDKDIN